MRAGPRILAKKGWISPDWPVEWGGTDWTVAQRYIFAEECGVAGCLPVVAFGVRMCGPVLLYLLGYERMDNVNIAASKRELGRVQGPRGADDDRRPTAPRQPAVPRPTEPRGSERHSNPVGIGKLYDHTDVSWRR